MRYRAITTLTFSLLAAGCIGCMTAFAAFQPENIGGETIVISTTDSDGKTYERVLSPIDVDRRRWPALRRGEPLAACVVSPSARESERQRDPRRQDHRLSRRTSQRTGARATA